MKTKVLLFIVLLSQSVMFSQTKLADKFFDVYAYTKAAEFYKEVVTKGKEDQHVLLRLGDCYFNNSDSKQAEYWYRKAFDKYSKDISPEYLYKYIHTLRSLKKYDEANRWANQLDNSKYDVSELSEALFIKLNATDSVYATVYSLPLNTEYTDFGGYQFKDKFYFSSTRPNNAKKNADKNKKTYLWNNEPYLELYEANISTADDSLAISDIALITSEDINTQGHESSIAITNDGKTMFFTRNNVKSKSKNAYNKKGTSNLKIYRAEWVDDTWTNVEELAINDDNFSTGHPALSPDNNTLYFVSDRPGGLGETDIYKVALNAGKTVGEPENLGEQINTSGREMFPFIAKDSTFYFSSDNHVNLGLLDIFKSNYLQAAENESILVENMGAPYNSGYDDFAFVINDNLKSGLFTSNRPNGKGNDDIYGFQIFDCKQRIEGTIFNKDSEAPLAGVTIKLLDDTGKVLQEIENNADGTYSFTVECDKNYTVVATKDDFERAFEDLKTDKTHDKTYTVDLNLKPLVKGGEIKLNPIYFDFDKWDIRPDAAFELEKIVDVMTKHPDMIIRIESHTDSRGKDDYNMELSDKRAKSTKRYLIDVRKIAKDRIVNAEGFGESQLVNECSNGVKCSEAKHQDNRRSRFIIVNQ